MLYHYTKKISAKYNYVHMTHDTTNILSWCHRMQHLTTCSVLKGFNNFFEQQHELQRVIKSQSDFRLILIIYIHEAVVQDQDQDPDRQDPDQDQDSDAQDQDQDPDRQDKDSDAQNQDQDQSQGQIKRHINSMTSAYCNVRGSFYK